MKKFAVLLLALLMLLPLCAACGDTPGEAPDSTPAAQTSGSNGPADVTTSIYDENGFERDDIPEGLNFNDTVHIFHWSDYTMTEFYVDEDNGNGIDSAIFKRNANVQERLGVTLEYSDAKGQSNSEFETKAKADFNADRTYDIFASYSRTIPSLALEGLCVNLLSTDYINVEKPWWPNVLTSECTINDKLFFASGDISTNLLWMMTATFYNRAMYENYRSNALFEKTPEEMVASNTWTMEQLFSMAKDIYQDSTGDGASADDTYGMIIYQTNIDAFQTAAGVTSICKTADGTIEVNPEWQGERMQDVVNLVGDFLKTTGVYYKDSTSVRTIFNEQRGLFIMDRTFIVAGKDNSSNKDKIEFSFGVIPQPKYSTDQPTFLTNMGHPFTMYGISVGSHNIPASAATLECLASESYRLVTPQVFENTMKIRYADGAEAAEMYDIIRNNVSFDLGRLYASTFGNTTANQFRVSATGTPSSFLSAVTRSKKIYETAIAKLTAAFAD